MELTSPDSVMAFGSSKVNNPSGMMARLRAALSFSDVTGQKVEPTFHQPVLYQPGVIHTYFGLSIPRLCAYRQTYIHTYVYIYIYIIVPMTAAYK